MALGYNAPGVPYNASYNYDGTGGVEALTGSVTGTIVTSGTIVGTGGDQPPADSGGGPPALAYRPHRPPRERYLSHRHGRVGGRTLLTGSVLGTAEHTLDDEEALVLLGAL